MEGKEEDDDDDDDDDDADDDDGADGDEEEERERVSGAAGVTVAHRMTFASSAAGVVESWPTISVLDDAADGDVGAASASTTVAATLSLSFSSSPLA